MKTAGFVIGLIFSLILFFTGAYILSVGEIVGAINNTNFEFVGGVTVICSIFMLIGSSVSLKHPSAGGYLVGFPALLCFLVGFTSTTVFPLIMLIIAACLLSGAARAEYKKRKEEKRLIKEHKKIESIFDQKELYQSMDQERDLKVKIKHDLKRRGLLDEEMEDYYKAMSPKGFLREARKAYINFKYYNPSENHKQIDLIIKEIDKYI